MHLRSSRNWYSFYSVILNRNKNGLVSLAHRDVIRVVTQLFSPLVETKNRQNCPKRMRPSLRGTVQGPVHTYQFFLGFI